VALQWALFINVATRDYHQLGSLETSTTDANMCKLQRIPTSPQKCDWHYGMVRWHTTQTHDDDDDDDDDDDNNDGGGDDDDDVALGP
jgi:hypothetical protein